MKLLVLLIVLAGVGIYFYPQFNEQAAGPCPALEKRVARVVQSQLADLPASADPRLTAALTAVRTALPLGGVAQAYVHDRFPALPAQIACVGAYWKLLIDPSVTKFTSGAMPVLQQRKG